jgi:hypothetical protein
MKAKTIMFSSRAEANEMDSLTRETERLMACGVVQSAPARAEEPGPLHPHPRRGRKRIHASGYARLKAYRRRKSGIRIKVADDNEIGL